MDLLEEYRRANLFFESGDPLGAARLLEPIIEAEPQNTAVRQLLARAYFASAQLTRAEEQLRVLVDRDPADHYAHHVLGRTLERSGRFAEALPHLRLAAAMKHDDDYLGALRRVETWLGKGPGQQEPSRENLGSDR
ncbi:MAG TPA: tetratricopeptide repeat protein [Actinoplanes sp.]|nr:tetratricopeptide repeat protein [Actinoplanes sp.]